MLYEVEVKFLVENPDKVVERLLVWGAVASPPIEQVDHYYNHPARDFGQTDEAFRIRSVGQTNCITYKGPRIDSSTKTRRELEVRFTDGPEAAQQMSELWSSLGFKFVSSVHKTRTPFSLQWHGQCFDLAIDQVPPVGTFLEIELQATESEREAAQDAILELSRQLDLGPSERRSYLELLFHHARQTIAEDMP